MSGSFVGKIQQFLGTIPPWFVRNTNIGTYLEAFGLSLDTVAESAIQGLRMSQPLRCDESALPILARDRGLRLYASEPVASQRRRLSRWHQLRRQFGTHAGQMRNIQPFFLSHVAVPRIRIVHQSGDGLSTTWHTLEADDTYTWHRATPSNWDWDDNDAQWSRYWVIIYTNTLGLAAQTEWGGADTWDGGQVWDGLLTEAQVADIVGGILEARAPHTKLWGVILATDPAWFDPTASVVVNAAGWSNLPGGNWGAVIDHATGKPTRQPGATWVYDLGEG